MTDNNAAETAGPLNRQLTPEEWKEFAWARPEGPGAATIFAQCPGCGFLMIDNLAADGRQVKRAHASCQGCGEYTMRGVVRLVNVAAGEVDRPIALRGDE